MTDISTPPAPIGTLSLQTVAMPADTNTNGDIFGGWLLSQMDLAAGIHAYRVARGRVTTAAISNMAFLKPVPVGAIVSCYTQLESVGRTSLKILVDVWCTGQESNDPFKVTEGEFVFVAIDEQRKSREIPKGQD